MTDADYEADKLFWVDAKLHMICSSNLDGSEQKIILMSQEYLKHPFSVAVFEVAYYHGLNGSSSPVLMATSLSYGKAKNSTPHRIKTSDLIEIKFGTVDYVGEMTPYAKFYVNPSKGGFPGNG